MSEYQRDYNLSDEAEARAYLEWAEAHGAVVDLAGNVIWPHEPEHPNNAGGGDGPR